MYPDVSAGTAGVILGGKEKIEIPLSGELEPGSDPLPGLTSEAHWGVKSPLREAGEERSPEPPGEHSSDVQKTFSLPPESQALVSERERSIEEGLKSSQEQPSEKEPGLPLDAAAQSQEPLRGQRSPDLPQEHIRGRGPRTEKLLGPQSEAHERNAALPVLDTEHLADHPGLPPELAHLPP